MDTPTTETEGAERSARPRRIVVLGAGFGGLELTTRLADAFGDDLDIVLIDRTEGFVFGFSKLEVMFGRAKPDGVFHPYRDIVKPGVRFVHATIESIDPAARTVVTDQGEFEADILVVALGADLDPDHTPGLLQGGYEFYTEAGAFALQKVLEHFKGGDVVVGVCSTPFKCPPAPSETVLLMHDFLTAKGLRDRSTISLVMPLPVPIPPSPEASAALLVAFEERGIAWHPEKLVRGLDAGRRMVELQNHEELPYDLFLGIPHHRVPHVVEASGLAVDGWIPVDSRTLETRFPDVYAVGDVTSVGTPKAGVFAEGQAAVVADRLIARIKAADPHAEYDGRGICYLEFGEHQVAKVDVTFVQGKPPVGGLQGPSPELAQDKVDFGVDRVKRWFGRDWSPTS